MYVYDKPWNVTKGQIKDVSKKFQEFIEPLEKKAFWIKPKVVSEKELPIEERKIQTGMVPKEEWSLLSSEDDLAMQPAK